MASPRVAVDEALTRARDAMEAGDYERAESILREVNERHPGDPLGALATLQRARLMVARDDVDGAARVAAGVSAAIDPALTMRRSLVLGLVAARRRNVAEGLATLRPLARRMIDPGESMEVDCALAVLEPLGGARVAPEEAARVDCRDPASRDLEPCRVGAGLRALARVAVVSWSGTRGVPTGLACDREEARAEMVRELLGRATDPRALADVIDVLPDGHPLRVDVARRLRAVAEERHETPRWLRWLADLPDTEATLNIAATVSDVPPLRVGVLATTSGARAYVGVEVLRAVQLALRGQRNVDLLIEDEGSTRASALAAFDRLAGQRLDAVIGPVQEESLHDLEAAADARGVELYHLAVDPDCEGARSRRVHQVFPSACDRGREVRAALVARGRAWRSFAAPGQPGDAVMWHISQGARDEQLTQVTTAGALTAVTGIVDMERRSLLLEQSARAPERWVIEARSGVPGAAGVWVGLRPGDEFEDFQAHYCQITGAPPGELALMAHDAARVVLEAHRRELGVVRALAPLPLTTGVVTASHVDDHAPAAARRCVSTVLPIPPSGDPQASE